MESTRSGDVLGDRYRLDDLLHEFATDGAAGGRFWRGTDLVLSRPVAIHVIAADDPRAPALMSAARRSAMVVDARLLRVLDAVTTDDICYVVNEWGRGISLDDLVAADGPLPARRAAYVAAEVADSLTVAHQVQVAHGRLVPENVLVDETGAVRLIGFAVDAALHGPATGEADPAAAVQQDLLDLAGLLTCALTGKWAGASASQVPRVPDDHGRVMRPRKVRAGVPRVLDDLCDTVLNQAESRRRTPGEQPPRIDARGFREVLNDFVGDPTGLPDELVSRSPEDSGPVDPAAATAALMRVTTGANPAVGRHAAADPFAASASGETAPVAPAPGDRTLFEADPDATQAALPPSPADVPTEAGLPPLDDDEDLEWYKPRAEKAPPPPPLEPPPERPLFAPDPPEGAPVRKSRDTPSTPSGGDGGTGGWPFAAGSAPVAPLRPAPHTPTHAGRSRAGSRWLMVAAAIGLVVVLVVGLIVAYNLGRGRGMLGGEEPSDTAAPSAAPTPSVVRRVNVDDLDPFGDPPDENSDIVGLAIDGDPNTSWRTQTYEQQFGPGGLKPGLGLVVDLRQTYDVTSLDLTMIGEPTGVSVYVTDERPSGVDGLEPVAEAEVGAQGTIELSGRGRYVVVWLTRLPQVSDGWRAEVAELEVSGVRAP